MDETPVPTIVAGLEDPGYQRMPPASNYSGSTGVHQSNYEQSGHQNTAAMSSGGSVIESEIIIPPEAPSVFTHAVDRKTMPPPSIPDSDSDDEPIISRGSDHHRDLNPPQQQQRPLPIRMFNVMGNKPHSQLDYAIPPPQRSNLGAPPQYFIPPQPLPEPVKKVPLDNRSIYGGPAPSTIIVVHNNTGPSNSPLPPKEQINKKGKKSRTPEEEKEHQRCMCCCMIVLLIILFIITITLAVVFPILRLHE